jgi:hypothetical protein
LAPFSRIYLLLRQPLKPILPTLQSHRKQPIPTSQDSVLFASRIIPTTFELELLARREKEYLSLIWSLILIALQLTTLLQIQTHWNILFHITALLLSITLRSLQSRFSRIRDFTSLIKSCIFRPIELSRLFSLRYRVTS